MACARQLAGRTPEQWVELRQGLGRDMRAGEAALTALQRKAGFVLAVGAQLGAGAHGSVVAVETEEGSMALKVYRNGGGILNHWPAAIMQKLLGELGMAPKVMGILSQAEMTRLAERFPAMAGAHHGMLMQRIADGESIKANRMPAVAVSKERLHERGRELAQALGRLRIMPSDLDFMISHDGELYLMDFEFYSWISEDCDLYSYQSQEPMKQVYQGKEDDSFPEGYRFLQPPDLMHYLQRYEALIDAQQNAARNGQ